MAEESSQQSTETEETLRRAIEALVSSGEPLTQERVSEAAGVSRSTLNRYPGAVEYLREQKAQTPDSLRRKHAGTVKALKLKIRERDETISVLVSKLVTLRDLYDDASRKLEGRDPDIIQLAESRSRNPQP